MQNQIYAGKIFAGDQGEQLLNVAISRARCLLVVVGNANAFSSLKIRLDEKEDFVYRKIVDIAKASHGYYTGKDVMGE